MVKMVRLLSSSGSKTSVISIKKIGNIFGEIRNNILIKKFKKCWGNLLRNFYLCIQGKDQQKTKNVRKSSNKSENGSLPKKRKLLRRKESEKWKLCIKIKYFSIRKNLQYKVEQNIPSGFLMEYLRVCTRRF